MKTRFATALLGLVLLATGPAAAQSFRLVETAMAPTTFGSITLGDLDNDGDLDVVIAGVEATGARAAHIYRNDGASGFSDTGASLPGTRDNSLDLGDYDNDGDLDLLIMGEGVADVFRNDGAFQFTPLRLGLPSVKSLGGIVAIVNTSAAAWGDYDNDGDLDILLSGVTVPSLTGTPTLLYENRGSGIFSRLSVALGDLINGSVEWGDYDNDGDLDILATSQPSQGAPFTTVYRNDGGATFTDTHAALPPLETGSARWGDYDNDGFLDVLVSGQVVAGSNRTEGIYRNLGNDLDNRFTHAPAQFPSATYGDWIDYDHDGRRDVLLHRFAGGKAAEASSIELFHNVDAQGRFEAASVALSGIWFGAITSGDLDRDGAADILATGGVLDDNGNVQDLALFYYQNRVSATPNAAPLPPDNLRGSLVGSDLVLEWSPAIDPDNEAGSLTYNVRVGTRPGASDVLSPMALPDGTRLVPRPGNAGHATRLVLRDVDPTRRYYWSVQALDASYVGSAFASAISTDTEAASDLEVPDAVALLGNYPNPFNPGTTIRYALPEAGPVRVTVYNMLGARIVDLVDEVRPAGQHEIYWDGRNAQGQGVPSGLYLYRLEAADRTLSRTMVLLK